MTRTMPTNVKLRAWLSEDGDRLLWFDDGSYRGLFKQNPNVGLLFSYPGKWDYVGHEIGFVMDTDVEQSSETALEFWESAQKEIPAIWID